jgi:hypothetical protein
VGQGLIQHGVAEMKPLMGVRLGHPEELSLHCVAGMLLQGGQDAEPCVGHGGSRTMVIRPVTAAGAGWPSKGALPHLGGKRMRARGQQRREFWCGESRHRP